MAGPLCQPSIYGMQTTVEWAVREYIEPKEKLPEIYCGLPLRLEMRVFIDAMQASLKKLSTEGTARRLSIMMEISKTR